ncbi:MAG: CocE/NonD family hydrolase [Solirubrobacterales bacterium]
MIAALLCCAWTASAADITQTATFKTSDGKSLHTILKGAEPLQPRPTIVEVTPYALTEESATFGDGYNRLIVHARGTGKSNGQWNAVGPRDQQDVSEVLGWACQQPWSNGHLGLLGFSASAIAVYNSLRLPLPCVDAAAVGAGSIDLYRDLLYPGGIPNLVPTVAVGLGVLAPMGAAKLEQTNVADAAEAAAGILGIGWNWLTRPTEDSWWTDHNVKPGPNTFPILAVTGFYDVESRGPFENFKALRSTNPGTHLEVIGAHDGSPSTLPAPWVQYGRWFDHYLRGIDNGIDREPAVQILLSKGSHGAMLKGDVKKVDASSWPAPGTTWQRLYLGDGEFQATPPEGPWWWRDMPMTKTYPAISSLALASDINTISTLGDIETLTPFTSQMNFADAASATYTTPPLKSAVDSAGPAALDIWLSATALETDIHAVLADVWPDGRAFPVAQGRLRTSFPNVDNSRSVFDSRGEMVQPYGNYSAKSYTAPLTTREYHVEFWPIGNRFEAGHRLRLYVMGTSPLMIPPAPGINSVVSGRSMPTRLLFPVLPGSDMCAAASLGSKCS